MSDRQAIHRLIRETQDPEMCAAALRARGAALESLLRMEKRSCRRWRFTAYCLGGALGALIWAIGTRVV